MKNLLKTALLFACLFSSLNVFLAQKHQDSTNHKSLEHYLKGIRLLTETQQYSEAMKKLKSIEDSEEIHATLKNQVSYRLMMSRVLRLSREFDAAMDQLLMLPNLDNDKDLKIKVDFRKAALFMENPKYSLEERIVLVYPIIDKGVKASEEMASFGDLASFLSLKAAMHSYECRRLKRKCKENNILAVECYKRSMDLFLLTEDTLNYHNVLNGFFRLAIAERRSDLDSIKDLVLEFTESSEYAPHLIGSRNSLAAYYLYIKKDSLKSLQQSILEKKAMIDLVNKNADNTVGKLKLLYEFDSLKADLKQNKLEVQKKESEIVDKNNRITENIIFSLILGVFSAILVFLFIRQKKLARKMRQSNMKLRDSNRNFELLIKESNHRIKNNLQMILSILELEKDETIDKENIMLTNISSKILTIAALHRILDFKEHNEKVELQVYFKEIIQYFEELSKNEINFVADFANLKIESERIIYFGLVLNELISNTIEHRKAKREIVIQVLKTDKDYVFTYRDYSNFGSFEKNSGIALIENLISRFDGVDLKFNPDFGEYKFYFNE